ncbi:MAG: methionine adenosyltransferase [Holosporaceae bacterium]|jgi:S-adenosylmethionine synthetase|nr:methionine adenosyltransferase [Holosporaceae bacterium]
MESEKFIFTSESVTEGHPDKIADQISDAILDAMLTLDEDSRVAAETLVTTGMVLIAGEISTNAYVDIPHLARKTIKKIGYNDPSLGFDWQTCAVLSSIDEQSRDIAVGVDQEAPEKQGAGDQGMMFGYACSETPSLMPAPICWAHQLSHKLAEVRKSGKVDFLKPDGKTQISFEYENGDPKKITNVVVSAQHAKNISHSQIEEAIREEVIYPLLEPSGFFNKNDCKIYVNATGSFEIGGPMGDCGLTGRKIIQDTYGGFGRHGGGAFSGKDPSKVDRSAAYMARYVAKNIVGAELAKKCEVQIAYCIGVAEPVSVFVTTFGTGVVPDDALAKAVRETFDLRPYFITKRLDLLRPIYKQTSCYGHFGRAEFSWEKLDAAEDLKKAAKA